MTAPTANPTTGEIIEPETYAPCGRKWGAPLWTDGPILGGVEWQTFVRERAKRKSDWRPAPKKERGVWE